MELLNGRYLAKHKLGFGGGSSIWVAHDLQHRVDVAPRVMSLDAFTLLTWKKNAHGWSHVCC
jgi:hypothetical protein